MTLKSVENVYVVGCLISPWQRQYFSAQILYVGVVAYTEHFLIGQRNQH